jgi:hypothetical protein
LHALFFNRCACQRAEDRANGIRVAAAFQRADQGRAEIARMA